MTGQKSVTAEFATTIVPVSDATLVATPASPQAKGTQVTFKAQGIGGYLKYLTGGVPVSLWPLWFVMVPVEILGLFTKPFALTVRLFANMVAGHFVILALLGLIFSISIAVAPASVALAMAIFMLELFVAFVQAYIFTMLSALFIGTGLVHHDEDHGGGGRGEEHGSGSHCVAGESRAMGSRARYAPRDNGRPVSWHRPMTTEQETT